jgi:glycosyltransferase involved in cell wall biosynthesis
MVRVLGLLPYPTSRAPGQRFRIEQWAPLLRRDGVEIAFVPFLRRQAMEILYRPGHALAKLGETLRGYAGRVGLLLRSLPFDAVFVYREAALLGPAWIEWILAHRLPLVFDFDDAIYLRSSAEANRMVAGLKSAIKTDRICRLARAVTVGNEALARYARLLAAAVVVIPTTIDTDEYRVESGGPNLRPIVGWSGSTTTLPHLETLAPALRELRRRTDFELRVVGGEMRIDGVELTCQPWRLETEVQDLRSFDVGLMPLEDDEWSRGKCGLKALQYMALGIPPVVSPVGVNATIVRDGENGFHARNDAEWVDRIERLLRNPELRARLGAAARRTVEETYSARVQAPRMAEVFRSVATTTRRT